MDVFKWVVKCASPSSEGVPIVIENIPNAICPNFILYGESIAWCQMFKCSLPMVQYILVALSAISPFISTVFTANDGDANSIEWDKEFDIETRYRRKMINSSNSHL